MTLFTIISVDTDNGNGQIPDVPENVRVTSVTASTITVTWDPSDHATSYTVVWRLSGGGEQSSGTDADTTMFTIHDLVAGTTYFITVTARNEVGDSASNTMTQATGKYKSFY